MDTIFHLPPRCQTHSPPGALPRSGRMVPEAGFQDTIREVIYQGYRIIYRIHNEQLLQIVTVVHGARDLTNMTPTPWEPPPQMP